MIKTFDELKEFILKNVNTFNFSTEHEFIYNTIKDMPKEITDNTVMVEIGSYCGASTLSMFLGAAQHDVQILCFDMFDLFFDNHAACNPNFKFMEMFASWLVNVRNAGYWRFGKIIPIIGFSQITLPLIEKEISFAWVDGSHNRDEAKMDIVNVDKKSKVGTVIACHDYGFSSDVIVAVNETLKQWTDRYEQIALVEYKIPLDADRAFFDNGIGGGSKGTWSPGMIAFRRIK